MKKTTFRLLSLFLVMFAMNQPAQAGDFLRDFFNEFFNPERWGDMVYSQVNAEPIGAGKVYVDWATGKEYTVEMAEGHLTNERIEYKSPDNDNSARRPWSLSDTGSKVHRYAFFAQAEEGWEFDGLYTNEACTTEYTPKDIDTSHGIYAAQIEITTSATNRNNQPVLNLFTRFALKVTLNKYGYSTLYYSKYNFEVPSGVEATTYTLGSDNKLVVSKTYSAGDVIPAGEAVVLKGGENTECKFKAVKGDYSAYSDSNNLLCGSDEAGTTEGSGKFYALSAKGGKVGFYWMAEGGAQFTNGAHKAYLVLPSSTVKGYAFDEDDATAIMAVEGADEDGAIYNVAGQRLNKMQKGINIVNGKKILKK